MRITKSSHSREKEKDSINFLLIRQGVRIQQWFLRLSEEAGTLNLSMLQEQPSRSCIEMHMHFVVRFSWCTVFAWSDTVATIYFSNHFCVASIWEWRIFNSVKTLCKYTCTKSTDGTGDDEIRCLKEGRVADYARETVKRDTTTLYLSASCHFIRSGRCKPLRGYRRGQRGAGGERSNFR